MSDNPKPPSSPQDSAGELTGGGTALRTGPTVDSVPPLGNVARLATGVVLAERFEIGQPLGSGGMGLVFEAFDKLAQETVAIKVLREDLYFSTEAKERFFAEARVSRTLSHPHIVRVHDVGSAGGRHFLTMERLRGQSLRQRIEQYKEAQRAFTLTEVLDIGGQLIEALDYANRYIVHRDVKPENIWLNEDGSLKLMDFGIARIFTNLRDTRFTVGTPYYMAPEQRRDPENVTWAADQYAVGVILYELLTGSVPEGAILPPRAVRKDVSRAVSNAVLTALAPNPKARFASWDGFEKALSGASASLDPMTLAKWLGGAAAVGVFAVILFLLKPEPEPPRPTLRPATLPRGTLLAEEQQAQKELKELRQLKELTVAARKPNTITVYPPAQQPTVAVGATPRLPAPAQPTPSLGAKLLPSIVQLIEQRLVGQMLSIPAGEFTLGDSVGDGAADERPVVRKRVGAFRLGRTEVTRAQFAAFVTATQYVTDAERDGRGCTTVTPGSGSSPLRVGSNWRDPGFTQGDSHPVVCVSWNDANAFIDWVNTQTKAKFRLPTEVEWEYAARAGNTGKYPWGSDATQVCKYANGTDLTPSPASKRNSQLMRLLAEVPCSDGFYYTAPVASLAPNDFGLYDTIGNVWEWTADCYYSNYTGSESTQLIRSLSLCSARVLRGGSRSDQPSQMRVSKRASSAAAERGNGTGFRIAEGGS